MLSGIDLISSPREWSPSIGVVAVTRMMCGGVVVTSRWPPLTPSCPRLWPARVGWVGTQEGLGLSRMGLVHQEGGLRLENRWCTSDVVGIGWRNVGSDMPWIVWDSWWWQGCLHQGIDSIIG